MMADEAATTPKFLRVHMRPGQAGTAYVDVPWDSFLDIEISVEGALLLIGEDNSWQTAFAPGTWAWTEYR